MANRVSATVDNDWEESVNEGKVYRPQLLWPRFSIEGDGFNENDAFAFFECKSTVQENRRCFSKILEKQGFFAGSSTFWECFRLSTNILFADKFFKEASYKRMLWELQEAFKARDKARKHIRVYCGENFEKINCLHRECEEENAEVFGLFAVEIKRLDRFNTTHDRFAIMDQEIWHCGAAVGGMHGELSALSRGWKDDGNRLRNYFCGGNENDA